MTSRTFFPLALLLATLCACSPRAELQELDEIRALEPPAVQTQGGELSPQQSRELLLRIAREAGASVSLLHHLAVEETYVDSPLVTGNRVHLLRDGDEAYPAMERAIASAKQHVNLEVYTFRDDAVGRRLFTVLAERARAGVEVNIVYDSVGCLQTPREFFDEMRRAGMRVVEFNPVNPAEARGEWRISQRDHRKLIVVDNRIAFTGGINISEEYSGRAWLRRPVGGRDSGHSRGSGMGWLRSGGGEENKAEAKGARGNDAAGGGSGSGGRSDTLSLARGEPPWRDTHVEIEGPVVTEFQKLFRDTWQRQRGPAVDWSRYFAPPPVAGFEIVRAIGSTADDDISAIHTTLLSAIARAERSVYLTQMYFVPDEELLDAVINAARRGVDVQLILPSEGFWLTRYAGRSHFTSLLKAGARVFERSGPLLHAKTAIIDGVWSTVGSANIDYRSFVNNDEVNAVILGEDFASELEAMFLLDIAESREITLREWRLRGPATRFKEGMARIWERWL